MIVVALVPAFNSADRVAATVSAAASIRGVTRVLVIDDGSTDDTADAAVASGAEVLILPANCGKGGAVRAGVEASPDADIFLLLDADLQETAAEGARVLQPVLADEADLAIAVLPAAAGRGGLGLIRDVAASGIRRACGFETAAPLSGQRAVRAELLTGLIDSERFGLEVAMTIDAVRAGARVVEVDAPIEHRHTGRSWSGFWHRGRQGIDVARSLWPRLTSARQRLGAVGVVGLVLAGLMIWSGTRWEPTTQPLAATPQRVVIFGFTPHDFDDWGRADTPTLDRIRREGASGAMTIRTISRRPSIAEGYLSLGAGARLRAAVGANLALATDAEIDGTSVAELVALATGVRPDGAIAVVGAPPTIRANQGVEVASDPGALADALAEAGVSAAVVGVNDRPETIGGPGSIERPAALAAMTSALDVSAGSVDAELLLMPDPNAAFGVRADPDAVVEAVASALDTAGLVVVDPGDLHRAAAYRSSTLPGVADDMRSEALARTDALLGAVIEAAGPDTLVFVVSVSPRGGGFRLTPVYAIGPGVEPGSWITSPSTKRTGLSALTDLAPTVVEALVGSAPTGFPGNPLRYEPGPVDADFLLRYDRETNIRERTYFAQAQMFIVAQALVYAGVALVVSRRRERTLAGAAARWFVLAVASYPAATFIVKAIPWATAGTVAVPAILAIATSALVATVASRRRGHALAGFDLILGLTVGVVVLDAATGTWLNVSSWLGYSLHSAGRFYGMPNTTFAVLGAATILLAASWVQHSRRRPEALASVVALFALVVLANGLPFLGGDVGGIVTFVPVFGLTFWALSGRRIQVRTLVVVGVATAAVFIAIAGIDLMRSEASRTHLGRFADQVLDEGLTPVIDTFLRKQAANFRIFRVSIWTWMIPVVAGFVLHLLVWGRGLRCSGSPPMTPAQS
jgi:hypothetical protein